MEKDIKLTIRINDTDNRFLDSQCKQFHVSKSEYIRRCFKNQKAEGYVYRQKIAAFLSEINCYLDEPTEENKENLRKEMNKLCRTLS